MRKKKTTTSAEAVTQEQEPEITSQELLFLQGIIQGLSNIEAFKQAYKGTPKEKWGYNSIATESSRYLKNPKLSTKLAEMKLKYEREMFMSLPYKRAELKAIWEDWNNSLKDRLAAMKLDAQLGQQLQQKIEIGGGMAMTHSVDDRVIQAVDKLFS